MMSNFLCFIGGAVFSLSVANLVKIKREQAQHRLKNLQDASARDLEIKRRVDDAIRTSNTPTVGEFSYTKADSK